MGLLEFAGGGAHLLAPGGRDLAEVTHQPRDLGEVEFHALRGRGAFLQIVEQAVALGAHLVGILEVAANLQRARQPEPRFKDPRVLGMRTEEGPECLFLANQVGVNH